MAPKIQLALREAVAKFDRNSVAGRKRKAEEERQEIVKEQTWFHLKRDYELSHLRLMGERRVDGDEYDNELLTDLTAVFHGFGIFMGNSPRNWDGQYSKWPGTDLRRPEYMTLPMFAYALAHAAWFRGDKRPEWYPFLSFELKPCFKQGIHYLMETRNSTFAPETVA